MHHQHHQQTKQKTESKEKKALPLNVLSLLSCGHTICSNESHAVIVTVCDDDLSIIIGHSICRVRSRVCMMLMIRSGGHRAPESDSKRMIQWRRASVMSINMAIIMNVVVIDGKT